MSIIVPKSASRHQHDFQEVRIDFAHAVNDSVFFQVFTWLHVLVVGMHHAFIFCHCLLML